MNIFYFDKDPTASAAYLDDRRLRKMSVETTQLLCGALQLHGCREPRLYKIPPGNKGPLNWTAAEYVNYAWLLDYWVALQTEHFMRFGKLNRTGKIFSFQDFYSWGKEYIPVKDGIFYPYPGAYSKTLDIYGEGSTVEEQYKDYLTKRILSSKLPTWSTLPREKS